MGKMKLCSLAAFALIAGSSAAQAADCRPPSASQSQTLLNQLDDDHQDTYRGMSCEGQNLAMKLSQQSCKGRNSCAGQNACAGANNSCAGKGSCKGTSSKPFEDKNKAVDVAQQVMAKKRMQSMKS